MISSSSILVRRILIALFVVLLPGATYAQEPNQAAQSGTEQAVSSQPVKPAEVPAPEQPSAPAEPAPDPAKGELQNVTNETYIIKQGDTLWDISSAFLKDPFLWPFIWKANPSIENADLIYPGNSLIIPNMTPIEQAMEAPQAPEQEAPPVADAEPDNVFGKRAPTYANTPSTDPGRITKLLLPDAVRIPIADKFTVLRAGFVGYDQSSDRIIGILGSEKTVFSYNDIVYVKITSKTVAPGDKFLIFTQVHRVKHPVSGDRYGKLIRIDGVLEIVAPGTGGQFSARIIVSFDTSTKNSMLTPYQDPPLIYANPPAKNKDIDGYVLDIRQDQTVSSQYEFIYLDKGTADGVELGDRFLIYSKVPKKSYPKNMVGEAQVILVKETTATAIVNKSLNTLVVGDAIEYKK